MIKEEKEKLLNIEKRIKSGKIVAQPAANFIRELNSYSETALDKAALELGYRTLTYRQMFLGWDKYSKIFTGLGITQENKSRVGLITCYDEISITLLYALNQMNVPVSLIHVTSLADHKKTLEQFKAEGITDFIVQNQYIDPGYVKDIRWLSKRATLRNRIAVKVKLAEKYNNPIAKALMNKTYHEILNIDGFVRMKSLITKYKETPINYGAFKDNNASIVLHTSGTTKGIAKPVPLSNKAINSAAFSLIRLESFQKLKGRVKTALEVPPYLAYGLVNQIHTILASGGEILLVPLIIYSDIFSENTSFGSNVLFAYEPMLRATREIKKGNKVNFSKFELILLGGLYISKENKKEIDDFLAEHGSKVKTTIGYGLSETSGCCILSDLDDESACFSKPMPGISLKIQDEKDGQFYDYNDGVHTGGLFIAGDQVSQGRIGNTVYFELVDIDGKKYLDTCDAVSSDGNGKLAFVGRTNRYFVNNDGVYFDESLVETVLSNQKGIKACVLAPRFNKAIHDTVPMLYLEHKESGQKAVDDLISSLKHCYIDEELINKTKLPSYIAFVKSFTYTASGKIDVAAVRAGKLTGENYAVIPEMEDGKLVDIKIVKDEDLFTDILTIPEEIAKSSGKSIKRELDMVTFAADMDKYFSFFAKFSKMCRK